MSSEADNVPLLDRQGNAQEEQPDVRFAIDEEVGVFDEHGGQSSHDQLHGTSATTSDAHKYPPAAPPPSYREATGKSALSVHLAQCLSYVRAPDFSGFGRMALRIWTFVCRYWPTSRFAQLGLFMAGLWVLVIVSGPVFEDAGSRAGAAYPWAGVDSLLENGPGPISGDGHVVAPANWTMKSCQTSKDHHGDILCISTTRIELDIPTNFHTTDSVFLFADPPRTNHLTDGRGHVPGTIEVKLVEEGDAPDQSPKGKIQVVIDAEYEKRRREVFEQSTVAKMQAGLVSQGVGIYTYPLASKYKHRYPPPLVMHIKILVPTDAAIPALKIQASAMSVGAFVEPIQYPTGPLRRRGVLTKIGHSRRAQDAGTTRAALQPAQYGRFIVQTGTAPVRIGKQVPIFAQGVVKATTYNGDIVVEGDLRSAEVRLETMTGNVRIEKDSHVMAWRESRAVSQTGNIELKEGSTFFSSEMMVKTNNGNIIGGGKNGGGVWKTNKTMEMQTFNGAIHASYVVVKPTDVFLNPSQLIRVETESKNGIVDVSFVDQEKETIVHAKMTTGVGIAGVHMHPNFLGKWELEGSRGASKVTGPGPNDGRKFIDEGPKTGAVKVRQKGSIGDLEDSVTKSSSVIVHSSLGPAQLTFD